MAVTEFQERVYALLCQIPKGKVSSYACLSKALSSSPRAVGGALRRNPFAPEVPCHRIINASGSIGGFKGEPQDAPSGINQIEKLRLLKSEGVLFDEKGNLVDKGRWWDDFKID
ncbi:DNA binding methylated-DNA--cysteine S-methyltransferase [Hyaloscypha hepaticicola]|uniref:Methylated-DNA--protein-cysteine methyltransferase n=1 Tax=Hyaloscypha hepaticicola TaxID=2082293 RepID=A0A2J6QQB7_9HELO|nr:DNA binding methylated-DNA--cysteine S-methyltransferase [Hyaloscypha hepaticicola]